MECENKPCNNELKKGQYKYCSLKCSATNSASIGGRASHNTERMKNGQGRKMGLKSREFENKVAESLNYDVIFLPQSICDRIVIIDGKPVLIEIKHKGERLRPKQKEAQRLLGDSYIVIEK